MATVKPARKFGEKDAEKPKRKSLNQVLMELVKAKGTAGSVSADEVARAFRPAQADEVKGKEAWRGFTRQVRGEAIGLARQGEIEILRRGEIIDPHKPFKGLYKMRLKEPEQEPEPEQAEEE